MKIFGKIGQITFESGRIVMTDEKKTTLYCRHSDMLSIATIAIGKKYVEMEVDGSIIESFSEYHRE